MSSPDPKNPQPTPDNPYPEPARPPDPPEEPPTREPPGVPPPSPDPIPMPGEPVQIPPDAPPEIPPQPSFPAPTARMRVGSAGACAVVVVVSLLALSSPAAAQASDEGSARQADPCQAEPQVDQQGQAAANEQRETAGAVDDDELSEMLERCRGVLKPPPTGDKEIAEPPPDTGTTPIIPPGSLPEQPPK